MSDEAETLDSPKHANLPERIGRYEILGCIGTGGMGTVYKACDPELNREVAVKVPRFDNTATDADQRLKRFQREARTAASILHPNVCPIFDVGAHEGWPFLVMALIDGPSLAQRLAERGRFEEVAEALALIRQVLDGIEAVHAKGILHRDIKPGNILLGPGGQAILTDFGLSRLESGDDGISSDGAILGTPAYMAPEQAAGKHDEIGPWTDLWSIGVVLYEMLTGKLPFEGTGIEYLAHVLREEPTPVGCHRPDLPQRVNQVVMKAITAQREGRFRSVKDFRGALNECVGAPKSRTTVASGEAIECETRASKVDDPPPKSTTLEIQVFNWRFGEVVSWAFGMLMMTSIMVGITFLAHSIADGEWKQGPVVGLVAIFAVVGIVAAAARNQNKLRNSSVGLFYFFEKLRSAPPPTGIGTDMRLVWRASIKQTLDNGVDPDSRNAEGETLLVKALEAGSYEVVKLLLLAGADVTLPDALGRTPLDIGKTFGRQELIALLEQPPARADLGPPKMPPKRSPRLKLVWLACSGAGVAIALAWMYWLAPREIAFLQEQGLEGIQASKNRLPDYFLFDVRILLWTIGIPIGFALYCVGVFSNVGASASRQPPEHRSGDR